MTAPLFDPYTILGVTAEASDDDLDHAFRGLVRQLHPDTRAPSGSDGDADRRLQEILTAYATLRDPIRRAAYDRARARATAANRAPSPRPRSPASPRNASPIRVVGPAIRVGPVRWEPPPLVTPLEANMGGDHDGH